MRAAVSSIEAPESPVTSSPVTSGGAASARVLFNARWIVTAAEGELLADLGWSAEDLVGQRVARLLSRSLRQAARPLLRALQRGASARADLMHESRLLHLDVHQVAPAADGAVARLDITDLTWDAPSEHERAHIERLEAIGYVAAGISHEINTPVQFVSDNLLFLEQSLHDLLGLAGDLQSSLNQTCTETALRARVAEALSRVDATFIETELAPAFEAVRTGLSRISRVAGDLRSFAKPPRGKVDVRVGDEIALAVGLVRRELLRVPQVSIDIADPLPVLTGHAGDLAQVMVSVLREVATRGRANDGVSVAPPQLPPNLLLHAYARRDWLFINVRFAGPVRASLPFAPIKSMAIDAPLRPMLADGFNVARALLREHYGGHLVIIAEPDAHVHLTIGLPLCSHVVGER